jgi:VWFA-related protein
MNRAAWLLTLLFPALAQQPAGPPRTQTISVTVVATDARGRAVAGLEAADFHVRDQGQPQQVDSAEFKRGVARLFALFFDEYHITAGPNTLQARDVLTHFLDEQTRAGDRFIAMKPLDQITAIGTSDDRDAIRRTIATFEGCKGNYTPRSAFEAEYMSRAAESAAVERNQVVVSDLTALAAQLGRVHDMPRAILFVTEGPAGDLRGVTRAAGRAGVPIYVIDVGTTADAAPALRSLAIESGAAYAASPAEALQVLAAAGRDLDAYYVLTFRTSAPADGQFHTIEIGTPRPDVQVRARRGYWAALPPVIRASGPSASFPIADLLAAHASKLIQPWFRLTRGPQGHTRITFSWQPGAAAAKTDAPEVVHLTAATPDGTAVFKGPVAVTSAAGTTDGQGVPPTRIVIDMAPGRLRTDMSISDAQNRVLDRDIRFLEIPNLYPAGVIITTPEILRTRTAREFRDIASNLDAPPTTAREFNRFERLLIRVRGYGPGDAVPQVTATLVNSLGQPLIQLSRVNGTPEGTAQFDLPLSTFARGSYSIEIVATSGSIKSSQMVPIRVIG